MDDTQEMCDDDAVENQMPAGSRLLLENHMFNKKASFFKEAFLLSLRLFCRCICQSEDD